MPRRRESRFSVKEIASAWSLIVPQEGTNRTEIVDVSDSGLRIESNRAFLPGEEIAIRVYNLVTFGVVRHCREFKAGCFSVGVHIRDSVTCQTGVPKGLVEILGKRTPVDPANSLTAA